MSVSVFCRVPGHPDPMTEGRSLQTFVCIWLKASPGSRAQWVLSPFLADKTKDEKRPRFIGSPEAFWKFPAGAHSQFLTGPTKWVKPKCVKVGRHPLPGPLKGTKPARLAWVCHTASRPPSELCHEKPGVRQTQASSHCCILALWPWTSLVSFGGHRFLHW